MAEVVIAAGSNLGDRLESLKQARQLLQSLSDRPVESSSVWESEPLGPAQYPFYNSVIILTCPLSPQALLVQLKDFERLGGRNHTEVRWGPRTIDLDIIAYDNLVIQDENLIIPHPEYRNRLFVLYPLQELRAGWRDPVTGTPMVQLVDDAPPLGIQKTNEVW